MSGFGERGKSQNGIEAQGFEFRPQSVMGGECSHHCTTHTPRTNHCTENIIQNNITSASPIGLLGVLALDALVEKKIS